MRPRLATMAVLLAGCHSSFTPAEPDAGSPADRVRAFFEALDAEECRRSIECEPDSDGSFWSQWECHPTIASRDDTIEHVERGEARFDADAAAECLRALRSRHGCVESEERQRCALAIVWTLIEGAPCEWTDDACADGLYCDHRTCRCERDAPLHGDCSDGTACGDDTWCWDETGTCEPLTGVGSGCRGICLEDDLYCADGFCAPLPSVSPGDPCPDGLDCPPGLTCQWSPVDLETRCEIPRTEGEPCSVYECADGLACITGVCQRLRREGEACFLPRECDPSAPHCTDGACTADPEGARCLRFAAPEDWSCPEGLRCNSSGTPEWEGTCVRVAAPGGPCTLPAECPEAQRCVAGRCVDIVMPDQPCGPDAVCPLTHACDDGRCVALPVFGEPCDSAHACLASTCIEGRCGRLPVGAACTSAFECAGTCDEGVCVPPVGEGAACATAAAVCDEGLGCTYRATDPVCARACSRR